MTPRRLDARPTAPLKRFCRISYGLGQPPKLSEGGVPILRATNIDRGRIDPNDLIYARVEDLPINRAPLLSEGEILVVRSGAYTGDSARISSEWTGAAPGYDLRLTPTQVDSRFLAYVLRTASFADRIELVKNRAAQPHLNAEELGNIGIPALPLRLQRRIADFLDAETAHIDALITRKRLLVEKLQERFLGFVGEAVCLVPDPGDPLNIRPSEVEGLPVVPARLAWRFRLGSGTTPRSDIDRYYSNVGIPWVVTGDLRDRYIDHVSRSVTREALADHSALVLHDAGSVVVAMYGATIGRLARLSTAATVNQACCVISRAKDDLPDFVFYWLLGFRRELIDRGRGAGQPNISQETLKEIRIALPSPHVQRRIIDMLDKERARVDELVGLLDRQTSLLQEHRQALMTAAVTGEMEVPGVPT